MQTIKYKIVFQSIYTISILLSLLYVYIYYIYTCHDDVYSEVVLQVVIIESS